MKRYYNIEACFNENPECTHMIHDLNTPEGCPPYLPAIILGIAPVGTIINNQHKVVITRECYESEVVPTLNPTHAAPADPQPIQAHEFLEKGAKHMRDRAEQRDAEDGERSMRRCVDAFNALEGTNLTEAQGWRFMVLLKYARSVNGVFVADDYEDMAAYAGLAGECASGSEAPTND